MLAKEEEFIARFAARASHAAQVQSRVKKLEKIEKIEPPRRIIEKTFDFKKAARSGDDVIKVDKVAKQYGAKKVHDGTSLRTPEGRLAGSASLLDAAWRELTPLVGDVAAALALGAVPRRVLEPARQLPGVSSTTRCTSRSRCARSAPRTSPRS